MSQTPDRPNRYAVPLADLEASAHVDQDDLVEAVPDPHAGRTWTSWDEQMKMLRLAGGVG